MLLSMAPPTFAGFHDYDYQSPEGADPLAKGTILSEVQSAQGGIYLSGLIHTMSVIVGGH